MKADLERRKHEALVVAQYVFFISAIMYFGRSILVPIAYAMLISFILYPMCTWLERRGASRMTAIIIAMVILSVPILTLLLILVKQLLDFGEEWGYLQPKLKAAFVSIQQYLTNSLGVSISQQKEWIEKLPSQLLGNAVALIKGTISVSASTMVMAIIIPVYTVLILFYRNVWKALVCKLLPSESTASITNMIALTIDAYYNFVKGMGIVYLAVGMLNSIGLLLLDVPHAFLFGFIASILTFVPYVGIMVGALLPITISWITHDSLWYPLGVIGVFTVVQYLEANIIFPLAVSNKLKVNTMAVLLSIFLGGALWGISGMILFVPFVGILKLIADSNPRWSAVSIALGTSIAASAADKPDVQ